MPITKEIPVPIVEVGMFLGQDDVQKVTNVLKKGPSGYLEESDFLSMCRAMNS
ncbi:MAG: hypothetical protein MR035_02910 [Dorea longicatena]|nr:hypothetical protein [Dorea longicatena]MDY3996159.1 hypothetical protein [Dorea longicatena]